MKKLTTIDKLASFLVGASRAIDMGCTMTDYHQSENADYNAIKSDWRMVGLDIQSAINIYSQKC